jgi:thiamine pyrophosphate-dependent acetolactate synthase large subunit-like protein
MEKNLIILMINGGRSDRTNKSPIFNEIKEKSGGQPTNSKIIELEKSAEVAKFKTYKISKKEQIKKIFSKIKKESGPICILVKIEKSSVRSIRVDITPPNIKTRFMKSLK